MFCCGCERKFDHRKTKKIVVSEQLIAKVCPSCGSEDIFTDKDMEQWHRAERKRKRQEKKELERGVDNML